MKKVIHFLFITTSLFVISCGTKKIATSTSAVIDSKPEVAVEKTPVVTESFAEGTEHSPKAAALSNKLLVGKQLYIDNCGKCHELYNAKKYDAIEWGKILNRMEVKAGISNAQRRMIEDYLVNS
jgi:cytochrome c5